MCIVVCDGLVGLPDAVAAVWSQALVQTCVVHLLRNSFRYASRRDWPASAKDLKPIYTAPTEAAALERLAVGKAFFVLACAPPSQHREGSSVEDDLVVLPALAVGLHDQLVVDAGDRPDERGGTALEVEVLPP